MRALWKGLTPFAVHLTLKYALRMGTNATYQSLLRDKVKTYIHLTCSCVDSMLVFNNLMVVKLTCCMIPVSIQPNSCCASNTGCFIVQQDYTDEGKLT